MRVAVIMGVYPEKEAARRRDATLACASDGTSIQFETLTGSFYNNQSSELDAAFLSEEICRRAQQLERDGVDAVVTFGTLDAGVELARRVVDIPVVGAGRAGFLAAAMVAYRVAVIVYRDTSIPSVHQMARSYGVSPFITSVRAVNVGLAEAATKLEELRAKLVNEARLAIEQDGAEVILPKGVTMVPVHFTSAEITRHVSAPVVDALAASIQMAEMLVRMGIKNSRQAYPASLLDSTPDGVPGQMVSTTEMSQSEK